MTVGGSEAIDNTIRAIVNVGDEVLIPEPSFVCYKPLTQMAGGVQVPLPTRAEDQSADGGQSARRYYAAHCCSSCRTRTTRPAQSATRDELQAIATVIKTRISLCCPMRFTT